MKKRNKLIEIAFWIITALVIIGLVIIAEYFAIKTLITVSVILFSLWLLAIMVSTTISHTNGLSKRRIIISHILTYVMFIIAGCSVILQFNEWQNKEQYSIQILDLRNQRDETDDADERQAIYLQIDEVEKEIKKANDIEFAFRMVFLIDLILFSVMGIINDTVQKKMREEEENPETKI